MDIKKLSYLYNLKEEQILKHKEYFNFSLNEYCCFYEPEPYINIELNNYIDSIEYLKKYFRNINFYDFYDKILLEATKINKTNLIRYDNTLEKYALRDHAILQYITNRPKTFILTIWPIAKEFIDEIILFLNRNGIVSVIRKINLSYLGGQNLINYFYNKIILSKTSIERKLKFINSKLEYTEFNKKDNEFYVIVFENINDLPISGTGAIFKTQIRQEILKIIKKKYPNKNVELSDIIHINDFFYESIEYAQIYFHEQTLLFLQKKNLKNCLHESLNPSFLRLNTIKKWQIKNLNSLESQRLILLTGSSFYTMGIRKSSDIDSIFINIKEESKREKDLENIIYQDFFNESSKIPFADSGMPDSNAWKDSWTEKNNKFYNSLDEKVDDFVLTMNPEMYYYYNGIKIMNFDMTILLKLDRYIPSDYMDFIILKELYPNITDVNIYLKRDEIWKDKKHRSTKKINELILKSYERYLIEDKRRINIKKYLL